VSHPYQIQSMLEDWYDEFIDEGLSVEEAEQAVLEKFEAIGE
jgi:hypothetical protein